MNINKPIKSIEWKITEKCNYKCNYCYQKNNIKKKHSSQQLIEKISELFNKLDDSWLIKIIGGEPLIHPNIDEIIKSIVRNGHKISFTTNFSSSLNKLKEIIDICGDKLEYITASLHLTEVRDIDGFITKAIEFNKIKNRKTNFTVTSVLTNKDFITLKKIENKLNENNIIFSYQIMKEKGRYVKYKEEIEKYIEDKKIKNTENLRSFKSLGTICYTGYQFFNIQSNGDVLRCYNHQPNYFLGNILKGTFEAFSKPMPCFSKICTCTVPANRNMIQYNEKEKLIRVVLQIIKSKFRKLNRNDFGN